MKLMPLTNDVYQQLVNEGYAYFEVHDVAEDFGHNRTLTLKALHGKPENETNCLSLSDADTLLRNENIPCYIMVV